jgi:hypothetical protein
MRETAGRYGVVTQMGNQGSASEGCDAPSNWLGRDHRTRCGGLTSGSVVATDRGNGPPTSRRSRRICSGTCGWAPPRTGPTILATAPPRGAVGAISAAAGWATWAATRPICCSAPCTSGPIVEFRSGQPQAGTGAHPLRRESLRSGCRGLSALDGRRLRDSRSRSTAAGQADLVHRRTASIGRGAARRRNDEMGRAAGRPRGAIFSDCPWNTRYALLPKAEFEGFQGPERTCHAARAITSEWIEACKGRGETFSSFAIGGPLTELHPIGQRCSNRRRTVRIRYAQRPGPESSGR